jgi:acyl-homoserine-lactone acylase
VATVAGVLLGTCLPGDAFAASNDRLASDDRAASDDRVEIDWTDHGIPHVVAPNFEGVGYGYGYAAATLDICGLADAFATFSGTRSAVFGGDRRDIVRILGRRPIANAVNDASRHLLMDEQARTAHGAGRSPRAEALARGFAAGINRFLRETPSDELPLACRDSGLVRPVSDRDVLNRMSGAATLLSSGLLLQEMFDAAPPAAGADPTPGGATVAAANAEPAGSNAYAFGRRRTGSGGLLLGNPHFFWDGPDRFMQVHLTVPGEYDAMGASLLGVPIVMIGFNASLAWTHTVSTDARGALHRLSLDPRDPTRYMLDGVSVPMTRRTITYRNRTADGESETVRHDFWLTRFGPVVEGPGMAWDRASAYALADANIDNVRLLDQWIDIGRSPDVRSLKSALAARDGLPWVNTIAADRDGEALYSDISVTPRITRPLAAACASPRSVPLARFLMPLDGSRSECLWSAKADRLLAAADKPSLLTDDYVANSNASHWLTNPGHLLEGFSPAVGAERTVPNFRTRQSHIQIQGVDRMTPATLKTLLFRGASLQADLVVPGVIATCRHTPSVTLADGTIVDLAKACRTLARWDRRYDLGSRGAHLFTMFASRMRPPGEDLAADPALWRIAFDPAALLATPRDFDGGAPRVLRALAEAVVELRKAGIAVDAKLGDVQFVERDGARIPLHGGATFSMMAATLVPGVGFTEPLSPSNSYIQVVSFGKDGPVADAILASSQTPDPASPFHSDQTRLYARKTWVRLPFTRIEVEAAAIVPPTILTIGAGE